jgi:hypothetical protein
MSAFQLSSEHIDWASRRKQGLCQKELYDLITKQKGRCALSGAQMVFDKKRGTPEAGGPGCHPLYAAIDHVAPKSRDQGCQIVCYDLNDLKGHLPPPLFSALAATEAWQSFMAAWSAQAESDPPDIKASKALLKRRTGDVLSFL